ncbi:MAG: hypothetical protein KDJ67_17460, partial [Nitratireductor sp.]|nr:hypothetical protein [Nitratireductor sp.]
MPGWFSFAILHHETEFQLRNRPNLPYKNENASTRAKTIKFPDCFNGDRFPVSINSAYCRLDLFVFPVPLLSLLVFDRLKDLLSNRCGKGRCDKADQKSN